MDKPRFHAEYEEYSPYNTVVSIYCNPLLDLGTRKQEDRYLMGTLVVKTKDWPQMKQNLIAAGWSVTEGAAD